MITGLDDIFTTGTDSALIAMLNDAIITAHIEDYQAALRVAENEARVFEGFGNDRMAILMTNQATHYRNRIAELESQLGGGS